MGISAKVSWKVKLCSFSNMVLLGRARFLCRWSTREFIQSEIQRNEDTKSGKEPLPLLSEAQGWKRDRRARLFENRHKGAL